MVQYLFWHYIFKHVNNIEHFIIEKVAAALIRRVLDYAAYALLTCTVSIDHDKTKLYATHECIGERTHTASYV